MKEQLKWDVKGVLQKWTPEQLEEYGQDANLHTEPASTEEFKGNLVLNEGVELMLNLLTGNTGYGAAYSAANAHIGVGNDNTPVLANQTGLLATSPAPVYRAMEVGYPAVSGTTLSFQATFGSTDANFEWNEWSVGNSSSGGINLNRKVVNLGTKAGGIWTLTISITVS